ncbi:glycosyltransferase family 2 protein [Methylocaldum sp. MU1018]
MNAIPAIEHGRYAEVDALLFTTNDSAGGRSDELERMVRSVERAMARSGLRVVQYLLLQRHGPDRPLPELPGYIRVTAIPERVSLSKARNLLLDLAHKDGLFERSLMVAFPDDDAWYPEGTLEGMLALFAGDDALDLAICRYSSKPWALSALPQGLSAARPVSAGKFVANASSNTMFFRAARAAQTGYFDESLGVGAPINGGEDLDYALRAYVASGEKAVWIDAPLVGHRDPHRWLIGHYYVGSLYALSRSAAANRAVALQAVRKVLVGVYLLLRRELAWTEFLRALRLTREARRNEPARS